MKKTLIVATIAAVVSTGAFAKPASGNHAPAPHNNGASVHHTMNHNAKPAVHAHTGHHNPAPYVAHVHSRPAHHAPAPVYHHHSYNNVNLLGDALISMAILALAFN